MWYTGLYVWVTQSGEDGEKFARNYDNLLLLGMVTKIVVRAFRKAMDDSTDCADFKYEWGHYY